MQYLISFLEGVITFISPCLLPMLPIYISYFAGGGERNIKRSLTGALGFVAGFTIVFVALGALAGTAGSFLLKYRRKYRLRFYRDLLWPQLPGDIQIKYIQRQPPPHGYAEHGLSLCLDVRRDLFGWLDALRGSFSGLGADPRLSAGPCPPGYADAVHLLHGTWTAFYPQRPAY